MASPCGIYLLDEAAEGGGLTWATDEELSQRIVTRLGTLTDQASVEKLRFHPAVIAAIARWSVEKPDWALAMRSAFHGRLELLAAERGPRRTGQA